MNDFDLSLFSETFEILYSQPAAAICSDGNIDFGSRAIQGCRLEPLSFADQYFDRLSTEVLPKAIGNAKTQADLVYHNLVSLPINEELLVLVPEHFDNEKLGLFLGIAKQAQIKVEHFIDSALAYSLDIPSRKTLHVLEIGRNNGSITELNIEEDFRETVNSELIDRLNFTGLIQESLNFIADEFIKQTRFNPFHSAASEQRLYNKLHYHFESKDSSISTVAIEDNGETRSVQINQDALNEKLASHVEFFDFSDVDTLVITPSVFRVPGLKVLLDRLVPNIITADHKRAVKNSISLVKNKPSDSVVRIKSGVSEVDYKKEQNSKKTTGVTKNKVTHLLLENNAFSIDQPKFKQIIDSLEKPLEPGQLITIDSKTYRAILLE
ncbi:hypothetical protein OAL14_02780 [Gammaproteobacteria bacterium]|nr:hypothetical protein [Gammaproteobacteria bacterium]